MSETITVTPEGRDGIWLADRPSLKAFIEAKGWTQIHNFAPSASMVIGADHDVESVLRDIDTASRVAVLTGDHRRDNLNHALALILPPDGGRPERLAMYDIGEITDADLDVHAEVSA